MQKTTSQFLIIFISILLITACSERHISDDIGIGPNLSKLKIMDGLRLFPCSLNVVIYESDTNYRIEEYSQMVSYKRQDTVFMNINYYFPCIKIVIVNNHCDFELNYTTDIANTFPAGEFDGTSYAPKLINQWLVVDDKNVEIGDTVCGVFYIESAFFRYKNDSRKDVYRGFFKTVVYDYTDSRVREFSPCM